jgi:hypothetical protein
MINTTLPKEAWTLNVGAEEGSEEDVYRCMGIGVDVKAILTPPCVFCI